MSFDEKLLEKVCEDALQEGYTYVEAYPMKSYENIQRNYHGSIELYHKFNFTLVKELEYEYLVRKYV